MKTSLLLAAALAAALPAHAGGAQTRSVEVRYGDLDLASDAGVKELNSRVRRAAASICIDRGTRGLALRNAQQKCFSAALSDASRKVELAVIEARSPMLAANREQGFRLHGEAAR